MKKQIVKKIALDKNWILINEEKSINIPISVPGSVYEALLENSLIKDPFYGLNEQEISWVYESDWKYQLDFNIEEEIINCKNLILRFNGLDTFSEIYLNNDLLGSIDNMFRIYEFEIMDKLKKSKNSLLVKFKSPIKKAREEIEKHRIKLNTGSDAIPGVPYLRKAQFSFGWDWGPKLPDIGLWKSVELIGYDEIKIDSFYITQSFDYTKTQNNSSELKEIPPIGISSAKIFIRIDLLSQIKKWSNNEYCCKIKLEAPDGTTLKNQIPINDDHVITEFDIEYPYLWWTHDLGIPNLYDLTIEIFKENIILDSINKKIGIRDLKLVRNTDEWGESFFFELNGIPIFAKGANWIPIDSFISRGKKLNLYERILNDAKKANMNMIRVWGGGIYEDNRFYEICDELGILVWQDFPFACAIYPFHPKFLENFKTEAIENVKRLRNHPSLALWCGNNEVEWLWRWLLNSSDITDKSSINDFKEGYIKIFEDIIPEILYINDPNRPYWPSSPSNGIIGEDLGNVNSNSPNTGDSHFWEVWHRNKPFKAYRKFDSRFMSEFGYESFPSIKTIKKFCPVEQLNFFSPIMENHQKNDAGNQKIFDYMQKRFSIPEEFEKQIILSQITQAEAIEYGVEHWRRKRNNFQCMGSLFWQLNDCWPVASWSSIDYFGRWKALHYFARRFYNSIFPSVKEGKNHVEFWVTNDLQISKEIKYEWKIYSSDSSIIKAGNFNRKILPCVSEMLGKISLAEINSSKNLFQNHVLLFNITCDGWIEHGFRLFGPPKDFKLQDPKLKLELLEVYLDENNTQHCKIEVFSERIALYVHITSEVFDFIASDNYFTLEPNNSRIISLTNVSHAFLSQSKIEDISINDFKIASLHDLIQNS